MALVVVRAIVSVTLALTSSHLRAVESQSIPKWARDFLAEWYLAYNSGDAGEHAKLFTADDLAPIWVART